MTEFMLNVVTMKMINFNFNDIQRREIEAKVAALVMTIRSSIFEESTIDTKEEESTIDTKEIEAALFDRLPGDDMRP